MSPKLEGSTEVATTWRFRDSFPGNVSPKRKGEVGLMPKGRRCCRQKDHQRQSQVKHNSISSVGSSAFLGIISEGGGGGRWDQRGSLVVRNRTLDLEYDAQRCWRWARLNTGELLSDLKFCPKR